MNKPFALIVDDDRDIVALFRHVLDMAGYHTEICLHGRTAIERLATSQPDIVLLDLNLPGISGTEILYMIRSQPRLKETRVVVITGHPHIAQTLEEEPDLVLYKPVNLEQLTNLVERLRPSERLVNESPLDEVTNFYNRSFFKSRLDYSLARLKQLDLSHFTVLLVDLDPPLAPEVAGTPEQRRRIIKDTARLLKSILRPTDTIAHFEGTKFAILIEDVRHWDIPIMLANRILARAGKYLEERSLPTHVNIGIILCHVGYADVKDILRDAEASLALAKSEGRNGYKFYAQDNFNNSYDLDMVSEMISLVGVEPLKAPAASRSVLLIRQVEKTQPKPRLIV